MDCNLLNDKKLSQLEKFFNVSAKLLIITNSNTNEKNKANELLNLINNINLKFLDIPENNIGILINNLCKYIQSTDTKLVINYCILIIKLMELEINLSSRTFFLCKQWILGVLEFADYSAIQDILRALKSIILISSYDSVNKDMEILLENKKLLLDLVINDSSHISETNILVLSCIEAILENREIHNGKMPSKYLKIIKQIVSQQFSHICAFNGADNHLIYKAISSCLRIWYYIILADNWLNQDQSIISELFGIIHSFMFHGIDGFPPIKPKFLYPATMNLPKNIQMSPQVSKNMNKNLSKARLKRQQLKKNAVANAQDKKITKLNCSDSDSSDSEVSNPNSINYQIRYEAIQLLRRTIAVISNRDMFNYWTQIIINTSDNNARVLMHLIMKETSPKLRQCALSTLTEAILQAKIFLVFAEESDHTTFITFFENVAAIVRKLHFNMSCIINKEHNIAVLIHALKCAAVLVQVTPYKRLKPGLAEQIFSSCKNYIFDKDPTVRVAAMSVFESLFSADPLTPEILSIMKEKLNDRVTQYLQESYKSLQIANGINNDTEENIYYTDVVTLAEKYEMISKKLGINNNMCFIVKISLINISNKNIQVPVRLQSLKLLNVLIKQDTEIFILNDFEVIIELLIEAAREIEPQIIFHACRVIEKISTYLTSTSTSAEKENQLQHFWHCIFELLISLVNNPHSSLREVVCDCFGTMSNSVFSHLPKNQSILMITMLLSLTRDEESSVRAGSLRALGMLVTLPTVEENTEFVVDMADVVCSGLQDENLGVRIKAAWALANVTDCLIRNARNAEYDHLSLCAILSNFYKASLNAISDNNKVKCNALRALGNTIVLHQISKLLIEDVVAGLEILIYCATHGNDMKVRWNACHAIGLVLKHESNDTLPSNWQDIIIPPLSSLIHESLNFKVRINAAWAISTCTSYGKYISLVWKSIALAFENSDSIPNFLEYNHRDALLQQLCLTIAHVAVSTKQSDLQKIWPEIKDHVSDIKKCLKQYQEHALPEGTNELLNAKLHFSERINCTLDEKNICSHLENLFDISTNFLD